MENMYKGLVLVCGGIVIDRDWDVEILERSVELNMKIDLFIVVLLLVGYVLEGVCW